VAQPRWGWHQLADDWAGRLVAAAGVQPGDLVLDIGAGTGALTAPLVRAGARVIAFELHPGRAAALRARFCAEPVKVVQADVADLRLPRRPFRVVANPPFAVTTAVLRRLLARGSMLQSADLVLPHYAAARWASGRGPDSNRWSRLFDVQMSRDIPHTAFRPSPPGATAVLRIRRRAD
jgi:23S rRNA (adenine-N6)-dimethyltransferase